MCKNDNLYTLKVSNRGSNITTLITNQKYSVNLPYDLQNRGACEITIIEGTIQVLTDDSVFHTYSELACKSNISQRGFDMESANVNSYGDINKLFDVDLTTYHTNNILQPFKMSNPRSFYCASLPPKIDFERVYTTTESTTTLAGDWYLSFTLQIRFLDEE